MLKMIIGVFIVLFIVGCEEQNITDQMTQESPTIVEKKQDSIMVDNNNDGMARRKWEYDSQEVGKKIVVNPKYYNENDFKRGEVIYYKTPEINRKKYPQVNPPENNISRVIALPGEVVQIKNGQVYINGKKLNTFYGKALSWGQEEKEYFNTVNKNGPISCDKSCLKTMKDYFNMDMEKFNVPEGHLFVMGDNWLRSIDSQIFDFLPIGNVIGNVQGYEK
jgi:signal peptidase I